MSGGGGSGKIKETSNQKEESRIKTDMWNHYVDIGEPGREEYSKRVSHLNTDAAKNFAAGTAAQSTTAAFGEAKDQAETGLASTGVNPNSGKWRSTLSDLNTEQSISSGTRQGNASNAKTGDYVQGLSNQVAIGEGEKTTALTGLSDLSNLSEAEAKQDAQISLQRQQTRQSVAGSLLGGGLAMYQHNNKPGISMPGVDVSLTKNQNTGQRTASSFGTSGF